MEGEQERGRRMNTLQIMYSHACKHRHDNCWNCSRSQGKGGWGQQWRGVNASMIYLIHCKNLCKCYNVPPCRTAIKNKLILNSLKHGKCDLNSCKRAIMIIQIIIFWIHWFNMILKFRNIENILLSQCL
jgi:hypothetical protein